MRKDNHKVSDFKVPIPYILEDDKEVDPLDSAGKPSDNPTVQVQSIFNGGTTEKFKWFQSLIFLLEGRTVGEHFRLALQALQGTDKALW
jgi:hypothetical protein